MDSIEKEDGTVQDEEEEESNRANNPWGYNKPGVCFIARVFNCFTYYSQLLIIP